MRHQVNPTIVTNNPRWFPLISLWISFFHFSFSKDCRWVWIGFDCGLELIFSSLLLPLILSNVLCCTSNSSFDHRFCLWLWLFVPPFWTFFSNSLYSACVYFIFKCFIFDFIRILGFMNQIKFEITNLFFWHWLHFLIWIWFEYCDCYSASF